MKKLSFLTLIFLFIACSGEKVDEKENVIETTFEDEATIEKPEENSVQDVIEIVPGGSHKEYHPGGQLKIEGQYDQNSQRTGLWISYYENGSKWSESYYVNGIQDGHSLTFFPNGQVRFVGEYKQGEKVGEWTFYNEAGEVTKTEVFEADSSKE